MNYKVIYQTDVSIDCLERDCFNLKQDLKQIGIKTAKEKEKIAEEILAEIKLGYGRNKCRKLSSQKIDEKNNLYIILAKVKVDKHSNSSHNELRCIVVVDELNEFCIVVHMYAKKYKADLTPKELNTAKEIIMDYCSIMKEGYNND